MRKGILKLIALVVALTVLLSGCTMPSLGDILEILNTPQVLTFDEMEYQRPDIDELEDQMQLFGRIILVGQISFQSLFPNAHYQWCL